MKNLFRYFLPLTILALSSINSAAEVINLTCDVSGTEKYTTGRIDRMHEMISVEISETQQRTLIQGKGIDISFVINTEKILPGDRTYDESDSSKWKLRVVRPELNIASEILIDRRAGNFAYESNISGGMASKFRGNCQKSDDNRRLF